MEYKLFFSYQSDTKDEKSFILSALFFSKEILRNEGIELEVDYGMRGVAGNPKLLDTMLAKGNSCDIFLADLTYVSTFINSSRHEKCIPNPNVMLELGNAWHSHGNNHTIFIQNIAKGKPEDLPVDLKGFRFSVSYTLTEDETKEKRREIRKKLCNELAEAIKDVISSINKQNKTKYLPFKKFVHWKSLQLKPEFIETDYFNDLSAEITKRLQQRKNVIISGKDGCGKSRIMNEIIKRQFEQRINDIFYCNMAQTNAPSLFEKLKNLEVELRRSSIFIIDNCNDTIYKQIKDEVLYESHHQCICLCNASKDIDIIKIDYKEYINQIIAYKCTDNWRSIIDECGYNLSHVICKIHDIPYTPNAYNELSEEENRIIECLSLFTKIGYLTYYRKEFEDFCPLFKLNPDNSSATIENLIERGYIIEKGGFIFIEADSVAKKYSQTLWENRLTENLKFKDLVDKGNLSEWFINRQVLVEEVSEKCSQFLKDVIKNELRQITFLDTLQGNHITYKLAEIFPEELLISLELVNANNADHVYNELYGIIEAIEIISKTKALFDSTISLLLKLSDRSKQKVNTRQIIIDLFRVGNNSNTNVESLKKLYNSGEVDLVKKIYSILFNIDYKDLPKEQTDYLHDAFMFLINIREHNKDWANNLILENIFAARYLGLARETFASIRTITDENNTDFIVAEKLTKQIRWASADDKKSIKRLLKDISERSVRNMLYQKVVLYQSDRLFNREEQKAAMENVAKDILSKDTGWTDCIDVLLKGSRQYDVNALLFGLALGQLYKDSDNLIDLCLNLYNTIPQDEQSHGFVVGLFYKFINGKDHSVFKQKRDEMLMNKHLVYLGIAMSNVCDNTIEDLSKIKDALIEFSLPIDNINKVYSVQLTGNEYCNFSLDLIKYSKEASDAGIKLLDRVKDANLTECLCTAITRYNYWDVVDYKYESAYSNLIDMLTNTLKSFPDKEFAKTIICSIIKNCNSRNFNPNYSVVDLFKILVEQYQELLLDNIEKLFDDEPLLERYWLSENYQKVGKLKELFSFCRGNGMKYFEWCNKSDNVARNVKAAEFVAEFIPIFKLNNENTIEKWTDEAMSLINGYCNNSNVLGVISGRLINGSVSVSKYQRLEQAYELLSNDLNETIRLWAKKEVEYLYECIKIENEEAQRRDVWPK
ncbi:MAG: hypothetical protein M0R23_02150 [Bacteroidales bacterium]|nr:hypothetical protein [Bacteroidales bacterium]